MSNVDEKKLAKAYNAALKLEKAGKREEAAAAWREVLVMDPEDHGGASVRLASLGFGDTPDRAPEAYVTMLFDQHADVFDKVLVEDLGYHVPLILRQRLMDIGVGLHLSEVKGPVMDRLQASHLIEALNGQVFLSQFDAWTALTGQPSRNAAE